MKKILVVYLGKKGAGPTYTYEMVKALIQTKQNVYVILSKYIENKNIWLDLNNNNLAQIYYIKTYRSKFELIINSLNISTYIRINKIIKDFNPDIIYSTMVNIWNPIVFYLGRNVLIKIKTIHDPIPHIGEDDIFTKLLHKSEFKQIDKVVLLSRNSVKYAISRGIKHENIIIIPHANFDYYRNSESHTTNEKLFNKILFFGRINEYKGLRYLLKAFILLQKTHPHLKLVIAGEGDCSIFEKELNEIPNNFELHNYWISDTMIHNLISEVDFLVLPYIDASQSGVIPLAYTFSKPVIATNIGGIPEQVIDNYTGILVNPHSEYELLNAIKYLYENPMKIHEMGKNAYDYSQNSLSWQNSADILIKSINESL